MSKKLIFLVLLLTFCLASSVQAGTIIWVDEGAVNSLPGWQTLLEDAGHTVTNRTDMGTLDADSLNEADLVIVSRDTNSGNCWQYSEKICDTLICNEGTPRSAN